MSGDVMIQMSGPAYERFCRKWREINGPEADAAARAQALHFMQQLVAVLAEVMPGAAVLKLLTRYLKENTMEKVNEIVVAVEEKKKIKLAILDEAIKKYVLMEN